MSTTRFPEDPAANVSSEPHLGEMRLIIPTITLLRVVVAVLLAMAAIWLFTSLSGVIVMIVLSLLIAVVLSELVNWLQKKGLKRGLAALISIVAVLVVISLVLAITIPPLVKELDEFFGNLPRISERLRAQLSGKPELYRALANKIEGVRANPESVLTGAFHFGWGLASNVIVGVLMLAMTLYFLIDGEKTRANVLWFTPEAYRARVEDTMTGISGVIKAYFIWPLDHIGVFRAVYLRSADCAAPAVRRGVRHSSVLSRRNPQHRIARRHHAPRVDCAGLQGDHDGDHRRRGPGGLQSNRKQLHPAARAEQNHECVAGRDVDWCAGRWEAARHYRRNPGGPRRGHAARAGTRVGPEWQRRARWLKRRHARPCKNTRREPRSIKRHAARECCRGS